jgi:hypothetical protein
MNGESQPEGTELPFAFKAPAAHYYYKGQSDKKSEDSNEDLEEQEPDSKLYYPAYKAAPAVAAYKAAAPVYKAAPASVYKAAPAKAYGAYKADDYAYKAAPAKAYGVSSVSQIH